VAVIEGGEISLAAGLGSKHPDQADSVQATTLFRIGSVTKMLTAVGLLQQVHAGQVELSTSVTTPLPDFALVGDAAWAPSIQVQDLLTHRSGLVDYLEIDAAAAYHSDDGLGDYLLGPYGLAYLMAPAGRFWNYSNPGYMVVGLVTEVLDGQGQSEYLRTRHFVGTRVQSLPPAPPPPSPLARARLLRLLHRARLDPSPWRLSRPPWSTPLTR